MESHTHLTVYEIGNWLARQKSNNRYTVLLLGSRAGALYRSIPFYEYCETDISYMYTRSPIRYFRECYNVLEKRQLNNVELYTLFQDFFKNIKYLLNESDRYFAEIIKRGYFREIISTNIDDIVESALRIGLIEDEDFDVFIPDTPFMSRKNTSYRLTKAFGDWQSRTYAIYNRQSYVADHEDLKQHLYTILNNSVVLAVGIDPHWDSHILPFLQDAPKALWFVNEEQDVIYDQRIAPLLNQEKTAILVNQNSDHRKFWPLLYQELHIESFRNDHGSHGRQLPSIQEKERSLSPMDAVSLNNASLQNEKSIRVLCLYCDNDLPLMQKFWEQLQGLERSNLIRVWHRALLAPGDPVELTQKQELRRSQLVFVGLSPSFLVSEYNEQAIQALDLNHKERTPIVVPLLLHPIPSSLWKQTLFSSITPLSRGGKTLNDFSSKDLDRELSNMVDDIHNLVKRLQNAEVAETAYEGMPPS